MVLKTLHGSTRKPCGQGTHRFLQILKKTECAFVYKCARLHFGQLEFLEPHLRDSWPACVGALEGEWYNLRDCGAEKGVHIPWVVQVEGNKRFVVGTTVAH
jgi:hypothetical protein